MHLFNNFARTSVALAVLAVSAAASAATETHAFDLTPTGLDMLGDLARTNWTTFLNVDQFKASTGTLTSVSINFDWAGHIDGSVANNSASLGTINTLNHNFSVRLTLGGTNYSKTTMSLAALDGVPGSVGAGSSYKYSFDRSGKASFSFANGDANFASLFVGSGKVDMSGAARGSYGLDFAGNLIEDHNTFGKLSGNVVYTYDAATSSVPGPSAALAMGIGALNTIRRRKARKA